MMHDYYQTLGVSSTADFEAIRQAYRRLALLNHPDRGGSHEVMVRINEAWNVLSNPATRAEYDQFRTQGQSAEDFHTPAAEKARADAADYPAQWSEFDKWWSGVGEDFHRTQFARNKGGGYFGLMAVAETPSGLCFIIGGVLAFWLLLPDGFIWPFWANRYGFLKLILLVTVGSWLGAMAHKITRALFFDAPANSPAGDGVAASFSTASHRADSMARVGAKSVRVPCPCCNQELRVPELAKPIRVTCKSCNHQFRKEPVHASPLPSK